MPRSRRMGSITLQIITSLQALEDFSMVLLRPACACLDNLSTSTINITLNAGPFFCAPVLVRTEPDCAISLMTSWTTKRSLLPASGGVHFYMVIGGYSSDLDRFIGGGLELAMF